MLPSRQSEGIALVAVLLTITWVIVGLRVYVRLCLSKCFGLDDVFLIFALLMYSTYCAFGLASVHHGVGLDPALISKADFPYAVMFWWLAAIFYNPTTLFVRLSISVFMHKICTSRIHKIIIWSTMGVVLAYSIVYFFITLLQCNPPSFFWNKYRGGRGTCINEDIIPASTIAHSVISGVADWTLGLLPIWLIWGLQMNRRTKISIGILLGLGIFAGIAALVRIKYVKTLGDDKKMFLYTIVDISIWSHIECALGIIAAACGALRPLFKKFYQLTTSGSRSAAYSNSHSRSHTLVNKFRSSSKSKSKSRTRSFGMGPSLGHGYATELHSNPSVVTAEGGHRSQSGVAVHGKSHGTTGKGGTVTFYKSDDDSSLELAPMDDGQEGNSASRGGATRGMGSQENLTGEKSGGRDADSARGTRDIHVHTLVEVTSGRKTG